MLNLNGEELLHPMITSPNEATQICLAESIQELEATIKEADRMIAIASILGRETLFLVQQRRNAINVLDQLRKDKNVNIDS